MPPKKKVAKTEELPTETETITEKVENTEVPNEEVENIQKPKKPKRKMTEKQQENFAKLQLANKERYEAKRKLKEQETNNKIQEVEVKQEEKKEIKSKPPKQEVVEEEEEEQEVIVKKKPVKKKKKQKIIIEEDSSSDSENEIIIRRSRGRKKSKPINIPQEQPEPEPMIDITPVEETKKEEEPCLTKKYTAQQILKGLGL